jgi:predicted DNA-binding ribbon-helix-helix protein
MIRTSLHLPAIVRTGLKRLALEHNTNMSTLIRTAVQLGLRDAETLAAVSMQYRRTTTGARTSLDLSRRVHRTLKSAAVDNDTTVQALIFAAITLTYPDLHP